MATAYIVLKERNPGVVGEEGGWDQIGPKRVEATSAPAAIRAALANRSDADGTFVAVPLRSWKPVTVKAEVTTVLKLEEAT